MNRVISSASKIAFLLFALTLCVAFLSVVFRNISSEQVVLAVVGAFGTSMGGMTTYYFVKRSGQQEPPQS